MASQPTALYPVRLKKILFATNFTEASAAALPYAAALARRFAAEVCVLHVISPEEYAHLAAGPLDAALNAMKQAARVRIQQILAASRFADVAFRLVIEHGEVLPVIAAFAQREQVDLIVAGSHGRHGIEKLLAPAVDEEIAEAAGRPVLLVGPEVSIAPEAEAHVARILFATDFAYESRSVLAYAYELAATLGAALYIMHVAENIWREPLSTRMTPEDFCRMRLRESELPEPASVLHPQFLVDFGDRESLILESAATAGVQLIVMGLPRVTHPALTSHLPGPLAYNVASHASCPVLAVRNAPKPEP